MVFAPAWQRTVLVNEVSGLTWEWGGVDWQALGNAPLRSFPPQIPNTGTWIYCSTYHATRQTIVMIVPNFTTNETELWEWNGSLWSLVPSPPSGDTPPTIASPWSTYFYNALAYDERSDQLVLFGRHSIINPNTTDGITWLWEATSGWTQLPVQSIAGQTSSMWYDQSRGHIVRHECFYTTTNPFAMHWLDLATGTWHPQAYVGAPLVGPGTYDATRNRFYSNRFSPQQVLHYLYDSNPAAYESHGAGCATATPPQLSLTHSWTRAWLGDTLSVDATSLPASVALLAMGFSDQSYGATALPVDLSPLGMPGCSLRTAPEAVLFASGSNNRATFQLPIPQATALLGVVFFQQVMAPAPGANALGMLVSGSMRGTVGLR